MYTITNKSAREIVKQVPYKTERVESWDAGIHGARRVMRQVVHGRDLKPGESILVPDHVRDLPELKKLEAARLIEVK